jgi:hypothetical protein
MQYIAKNNIRLDGRHVQRGTMVEFARIPEVLRADFEPVGAEPTYSPSLIPELPNVAPAPVAVVVSCYSGHLACVANQIHAVNMQSAPVSQKILALDNCEYEAPDDWQVVRGEWGGPNQGRNDALTLVKCDWVIFADADDVMDPHFVDAMGRYAATATRDTAIIYADIARESGSGLTVTPDNLRYADQLKTNHVSACSCWRVHAIRESGGWPVPNDRYDDWTLANRLMARQWKAVRQGVVPIRCYPAENRALDHRSNCEHRINKWQHRTYTIVTLLAGRESCLQPWLSWLEKEDVPTHTRLLVVDNSHNADFRQRVSLALACMAKFEAVEFRRCDLDLRDAGSRHGEWGRRHLHVSRIYTEVLPSLATDFTLLLEDDVIPPSGAFRQLVDCINYWGNIAGVSGVYDSRHPGVIVGASHGEYWANCYKRIDLPATGMHDAGFIAGGFSLWRTGVILDALPLAWDEWQGHLRGWDTLLSLRARQQGFRLQICCDIQCDHMTGADGNQDQAEKPKPAKKRGRNVQRR